MRNLIRIDGQVPLVCMRTANDKYVAVSEHLQLTLQADTWAELMETIVETLDAIFRDLLASNELTHFLRDRGWHVVGQLPKKQEGIRFDIPFFPAMAGTHGSQTKLHQ